MILWDLMVVNNWHVFLKEYAKVVSGWAYDFLCYYNVFTTDETKSIIWRTSNNFLRSLHVFYWVPYILEYTLRHNTYTRRLTNTVLFPRLNSSFIVFHLSIHCGFRSLPGFGEGDRLKRSVHWYRRSFTFAPHFVCQGKHRRPVWTIRYTKVTCFSLFQMGAAVFCRVVFDIRHSHH